jgi:hypothetical protein
LYAQRGAEKRHTDEGNKKNKDNPLPSFPQPFLKELMNYLQEHPCGQHPWCHLAIEAVS